MSEFSVKFNYKIPKLQRLLLYFLIGNGENEDGTEDFYSMASRIYKGLVKCKLQNPTQIHLRYRQWIYT